MRSTWILVSALGVMAAACTSPADEPTTSTIPSDTGAVVVTVTQSGGCFMMGPNCPTYVVHANGQVDLFRTDEMNTPVDSAVIDVALLDSLTEQVHSTDFVALRARLPEGECQGCFDGIDTTLAIATRNGEVMFSSIDEELNRTEPLFDAVWNIIRAANQSTEMPLAQRP